MSPDWAGIAVANVSAASDLDMQTVLGVIAVLLPTFPTIHFGKLSG
jgi:hypothetical protein